MSCSSSVKTVDVKQDNSPRREQHRDEAKTVQVKFWTFKKKKTYLHRDGKAASADFPAGISVRRESAAGKLGL